MTVEQNLLDSIPTGEVIKDARVGVHPEARIAEVELIEQKNGHAIRVTYNGLQDEEGRQFEFSERYTIPTSQSERFIKGLFVDALHAWDLAPYEDGRSPVADNEEVRQQIYQAVNGKKGLTVPLSLKTGKGGYLQSRFLRKRG